MKYFFRSAFLSATLWVGGNATAQTSTWIQTSGGPYLWTTGANWTPSGPPNGVNSIANVNANLTADLVINLDASILLDILTIGDNTSPNFGYSILPVAGQTITFNNTDAVAALLTKNGTATDTIGALMIVNDTVNANITGGTLLLSGGLTVNGNGVQSGAEEFVKNGGGTLTISGNTTVEATGGIQVNAGTANFTGALNRFSGRFTQSGGTSNISGANNVLNLPTGSGNSIEVAGGSFNVGSPTIAANSFIHGLVNITGGALNVGLNGGASSAVLNAGNLTMSAGTLRLQNGNGGGSTTILAGASPLSVGTTVTLGNPTIPVSSTVGLEKGMRVFGPGIPAGAFIASFAPGVSITLNAPAAPTLAGTNVPLVFGAGVAGRTGTTSVGSPTITGVADTTGLAVGQTLTGVGIPFGSRILSIVANTSVTLDTNATALGAGVALNAFTPGTLNITGGTVETHATGGATGFTNFDPSLNLVLSNAATFNFADNTSPSFGRATANGTSTLSVLNTTGFAVGQTVTGTGVPGGSTISSIIPGVSITLNNAVPAASISNLAVNNVTKATAGTTVNTSTITLPDTNGLAVGMTVSGNGIPGGSVITAVGPGNQITINFRATAGATITNFSAGVPVGSASTTAGSTTVTVMSGASGFAVGDTITGSNIPSSTQILAISGNTLTLSQAATGTGNINNLATRQNVVLSSVITSSNNAVLRLSSGDNTLTVGTNGVGTDTFAGTLNFSGVGSSGRLIKVGTNTLDLSGTLDNNSARVDVQEGTVLLSKASTPLVHAIGTSLLIGDADAATETARIAGSFPYAAHTDKPIYITPVNNYRDQIVRTADVDLRSSSGVLDLNGNSEGFNALLGSGIVRNNGATAATLIVGQNNATSTFSGTLQDGTSALGIIKAGAGTMVFLGNSTLTGSVTPSYGTTLLTGTTGAFSAASAVRVSDATLFLSDTVMLVNGSTTNGTNIITVSSTSGLSVGDVITGTGIPASTTITAILSGTQLVLNNFATASNGGLTFLSKTASNSNRIGDNTDVYLNNGTLTVRNSLAAGGTLMVAGVPTFTTNDTRENMGDLVIDQGHGIIRTDHSANVANTIRLEFDTFSRVGGSQVSIVENTGNQGGFGTGITPENTRSQVTVGTIPTAFLIGGGGAVGTSTVSLLQGAFGGNMNNFTNEFMTVQTVAGVNYIRPLNNGGSEYATLTSGSVLSDVGRATANTTLNANTAYNSLRYSGQNTQINIADGRTLKLGGNSDPLFGATTQGAGMMILASNATTIRGGTLDFGSREFILRGNGSGVIQSSITGTNAVSGFTKSGGGHLDILGANTYTGETVIAQGSLRVFNSQGLGASGVGNGTRIMTGGLNGDTLIIGNGVIIGSASSREDLVMELDSRFSAADQNNVWYGNITVDSATTSGQNFNSYLRTRSDSAILTINGNVTGGGNQIDPSFTGGGGRVLALIGDNLRDGIININGSISDQSGVSALLGDHEKLNLIVRGTTTPSLPVSEFAVNIQDAARLHGALDLRSGIVRLAGNFGTDTSFVAPGAAAATQNMIMRLRDSGTDSPNQIGVFSMTTPGTTYNVSSIVWGDNDGGYSATSYGMLAAEINSGKVTIGNGTGSLDMTPAADFVTSQSFSGSGTGTVGANGNIITLSTFQVGKTFGHLREGMLLTGTNIPASTYIVKLDPGTNTITLNNGLSGTTGQSITGSFFFNDALANSTTTITNATVSVGSTILTTTTGGFSVGMPVSGAGIPAGALITAITPGVSFNISAPATVPGTNVTVTGTVNGSTQRYADARLFAAAGGELDLRMRLLDDGGFSLDNEVGAVTKVGAGTVRLSGATGLSGELDGGINLHGGTLLLDYTSNNGRKITSGSNQQVPITLAGGDVHMIGNATLQDSQEEMRGVLFMRPGDSMIRVQSGSPANTTTLNIGLPANLLNNVGMLPVRSAGSTMAIWRDVSLGGNSVITLEVPDIYTGSVVLPWATWVDQVSGKVWDFTYVTAGNSALDPLGVKAAGGNGLFSQENGAQFWNQTGLGGNYLNGYVSEASEIFPGEGSGFFGTYDPSDPNNQGESNLLRVLMFNIDNDNTNGTTNPDPNNVIQVASGQTMKLHSNLTTGFLGGAILISNQVGDTNKRITGGAISSGLETSYFDPDVNNLLRKTYDLIVHNYAEVPNFITPSSGGGIFTIESNIANNPADPTAPLNLVHSGTGWTKLYRASDGTDDGNGLGQGYTYTGGTYFNGGANDGGNGATIWVSNPNKLGANPSSFDADNLYFTGGRLRLADMTNSTGVLVDAVDANIVLNSNRGITIGGDGAFIDLAAAGTTFTVDSRISVEAQAPTFAGGIVRTSNLGLGDLTKEGLGTMVITNQTNNYSGITRVKSGVLQANLTANVIPPTINQNATYQNQGVLGSSYTYIDGTVVDAGARLNFRSLTAGFGTSEWITLDGGTLGTTADHVDGNIEGMVRVRASSTIDVQSTGTLRLNTDAAYMIGAGDITKTGSGTLALYENTTEYTGNWNIRNGVVTGASQGLPLGAGSAITLGDTNSVTGGNAALLLSSRVTPTVVIPNVTTTASNSVSVPSTDGMYVGMSITGPAFAANTVIVQVVDGTRILVSANATATTGTLTATLNNTTFPLTYTVPQNIVVQSDGAGSQVKRLGASNNTLISQSGQQNDRYTFGATGTSITLNEDLILSYADGNTNAGITASGRDVFIALNGAIIGAVGNDITTEVNYIGDGLGNTSNDVRAYFELNADNTAWAGDLIMGENVADVDQQHIVRLGHNNSLKSDNNVRMNFNNVLQVGGRDVTIGQLFVDATGVASGSGALLTNSGIIVENASNTAGKLTINQTTNEQWDVIFQNGTTPGVYSASAPAIRDNTLSLVKLGSTGTATMTQISTYTGTTQIGSLNGLSGGELELGTGGAISPNSTLTVFAGTFDNNSGASQTYNQVVTLGGGASGTSAVFSTTGASSINTLGNNVVYDATNNPNGASISGNLSLGTAIRTFDVGNSTAAADDLVVFANVSGTGGVLKNNSGTMVLSGTTSNYTGLTTVNAGVLRVTTSSALGTAAGGTTVISGAALEIDGSGGNITNAEPLNLAGTGIGSTGALRSLAGNNTDSGIVTLSGNTDVSVVAGSLTLSGKVTGGFGITKEGSGALVLSGTGNDYTGGTTVSEGLLQVGVAGTGSTGTTGAGATTVAALATLAGTGTVNGTANTTAHVLDGLLRPGDNSGSSNGTLAFVGNLSATSLGSEFILQVTSPTGVYGGPMTDLVQGSANYNAALNTIVTNFGTANAGAHDQIDGLGTLTLSGNSRITVVNQAATFSVGDVFNLFDWTSLALGAFDLGGNVRNGGLVGDLDLPTLSGIQAWDTSMFASSGVFVVVNFVPEPSRMILTLLGVFSLMLRRNRRTK